MKKSTLKSWDAYGSDAALEELCGKLKDFLTQNKTEREIVRSTLSQLRAMGARPIEECRNAKPGDVVYMNWKNRAVAAAKIGTAPAAQGINAIISHGDSPRIDVKERPLYGKDNLALLDCHYYGGIKKYNWVNVPMALHGELHDGKGGITPLVLGEKDDEPIFTIPDLEIHVDSDLAKRTAKEAVDGENLDVLSGSITESVDDEKSADVLKKLKKLLSKRWGLSEKVLTSADLTFVPAGAARDLGFDRSLIGSYGLDDRICTAASWFAFLSCNETPERPMVHMVMDKEEIGSDGVSGADGAFFETFLLELLRLESSPCHDLALRRAAAASLAISADVTSGSNPLYPSSYVRDQQPLCGNGVVIVKSSGSGGKYNASEARGEMMAAVIALLDAEDIPWQVGSFGRVDKAGGGTLGKYIARLGVDVIDVGPALLSMHTPLEIASKADFMALERCYRAFFTGMKALA
ncbi:MAG: aminopeptidase 1 [Pyramidobacter sp.]